MNYLLDTNVVSEWVKPQPNRDVIAWLAAVDEDRVFLSVVTIAEIRRGIERLAPSRRRDSLQSWLDAELPSRFERRIAVIDTPIANAWGVMMTRVEKSGVGLGTMDAFLAATAATLDLTLVTRNTDDFEAVGVKLFNPWIAP
ncbi:MAG TPA: type II toxin-antitoxin system VapC family toxin [Steroidobacteraceae bacterium]|nr:type II toxin-antitoxin system VapC family toxin [Steroidobacteraceae bacterium]